MKLWTFACWNCGVEIVGRVHANRVVAASGNFIAIETRHMRCASCSKKGGQPDAAVPICPECAEPYLNEDRDKRGPCSLCREERAHQRDVDRQDRHDAAKYD